MNMEYMFEGCGSVDQPLDKWDVSNVTNMERMFRWCESFNCDISNWKLNNDCNTKLMFDYCPLERQPKKWPQNYKMD